MSNPADEFPPFSGFQSRENAQIYKPSCNPKSSAAYIHYFREPAYSPYLTLGRQL